MVQRSAVERPLLADFVSKSPVMKAFMGLVHRVAGSDTPLLVLGETGVGKEHLARAIHAASARHSGPFMALNCGALTESLLESELFGHEVGAFTGAAKLRRGCFELAHRGTLFLDEVGEMPPHLQVKLLRVLQEFEFFRVGGERAVSVDVRVIAATNRDLQEQVNVGAFRSDLFYRLGVVSLTIPPLRERAEDIPELVETYLRHFRPRIGTLVDGIEPSALRAMVSYPWPGNLRELINIIERAMLLSDGPLLTLTDLPQSVAGAVAQLAGATAETLDLHGDSWVEVLLAGSLPEACEAMVSQVERAYLEAALKASRGRIGVTAERAGITTRSLYAKMKRYGFDKADFR